VIEVDHFLNDIDISYVDGHGLEKYRRDRKVIVGMDVIEEVHPGSGVRDTFFWGDLVVKIAYGAYKYQTNRELYHWCEKVEEEDRQYFTPIIAHGESENEDQPFSWVIQPYMEMEFPTVGSREPSTARAIIEHLVTKYNFGDIFTSSEGDTYCNWSIVNGHPMIHDYGA